MTMDTSAHVDQFPPLQARRDRGGTHFILLVEPMFVLVCLNSSTIYFTSKKSFFLYVKSINCTSPLPAYDTLQPEANMTGTGAVENTQQNRNFCALYMTKKDIDGPKKIERTSRYALSLGVAGTCCATLQIQCIVQNVRS